MVDPLKDREMAMELAMERERFSDRSQRNVYAASRGVNVNISQKSVVDRLVMDSEVVNLVNWLAEQQGISPELALKKAVVSAAYIYDVTNTQGGKLLVQRKDKSIGEIILK